MCSAVFSINVPHFVFDELCWFCALYFYHVYRWTWLLCDCCRRRAWKKPLSGWTWTAPASYLATTWGWCWVRPTTTRSSTRCWRWINRGRHRQYHYNSSTPIVFNSTTHFYWGEAQKHLIQDFFYSLELSVLDVKPNNINTTYVVLYQSLTQHAWRETQ